MKDEPTVLRTAQWLGANALVFWALLAMLLVAVTLFSWRLLQHPAWRQPRQPTAALPHGTRMAMGCASLALSSVVFAWLAHEHREGRALSTFDLAFTDALALSSPVGVVQVAALLTRLGDPITLSVLGTAVGALLLWKRRVGLMLGWGLALAGNGILNLALKHVFARIRPLHAAEGVSAIGFSFPSGHSSGTVVACGMLAYLGLRMMPPRWHLPVLLAAMLLAFSVGVSRIILRVHYVSDVAAGFASGTAWLALCLTGIEFCRWLRHRTIPAPGSAKRTTAD